MMESNFREYYQGSEFEYREDELLLKTLKRQITSYLKESTFERFHSIWNKIYILRKSLDKDKFYDIMLEEMDTNDRKKFMEFILTESKEDVPNIWLHQLNKLK